MHAPLLLLKSRVTALYGNLGNFLKDNAVIAQTGRYDEVVVLAILDRLDCFRRDLQAALGLVHLLGVSHGLVEMPVNFGHVLFSGLVGDISFIEAVKESLLVVRCVI